LSIPMETALFHITSWMRGLSPDHARVLAVAYIAHLLDKRPGEHGLTAVVAKQRCILGLCQRSAKNRVVVDAWVSGQCGIGELSHISVHHDYAEVHGVVGDGQTNGRQQ